MHSPMGKTKCQPEYRRRTIVKSPDHGSPRWLWFFLFAPYLGLLCLPFYNSAQPEWFGFPFFYWYQFLWVPITSLLLYIAYRSMK